MASAVNTYLVLADGRLLATMGIALHGGLEGMQVPKSRKQNDKSHRNKGKNGGSAACQMKCVEISALSPTYGLR